VKVTVSVLGRFHAYELAAQLERNRVLHQLLTSLPKSQTDRFGIPRDKVRTFLLPEILKRGFDHFSTTKIGVLGNPLASCLYANWAAGELEQGQDIFVGWSGFSLPALQRAKRLGAVTVVERHSAHMALQQELMEEEYRRHGLVFSQTHASLRERELAEYAAADFISVPSLYVKRTFIEKGFAPERILHTPLAANTRDFFPVAKEDNVFRVVHCGAVSLRKGVQYLLQAFSELRLPGAELWLLGAVDHSMQNVLKKYASDAVVVHGPKPAAELKWYLSQCDIFALASIEDGFGMVVPQAMACGLPVVCTENTCADDIVREGQDGFIVPIRDVQKLKEKISWLYEHPEQRAEMAASARVRMTQAFGWNEYGEAMVAQYRKILEPKPQAESRAAKTPNTSRRTDGNTPSATPM
jgi:glycosyltransferase involved in cell wall biosynthesis